MTINITSGDCLNSILDDNKELYIPFREALIKGNYSSIPFSNEFILERVKALNTTKEEYLDKLNVFVSFLDNIDQYKKIILWFGDEDFCLINRNFVINEIKKRKYKGSLVLNIVNEETGEILRQEILQ